MNRHESQAPWPPRRADFEADLESDLEPSERRELGAFAAQLTEQRPVPRPGWRSAVRARLLGTSGEASRRRIRGLVFGYAASGALLLVVAAVGLAGVGPFAS
jgi:hypothetical protein